MDKEIQAAAPYGSCPYYKEVVDLIIQHNMSALNADRMLGITRWQLAGRAERLASGYKINRAADDAAGLSISEEMRKKIRGLKKGMENIQDGISLCQVADGALDEVTGMIQRMRELSIQAYNGTNSKSDRHTIQEEITQCINGSDKIFDTTKSNEIYIFRNGGRVQGEIFHAETYTERMLVRAMKDMPSWLKINDAVIAPGASPTIGMHPGYLSQETQDVSKIMKQEFRLKDGSYVQLYYGDDQGTTADGFRWVGDFLKNDGNTAAYKELVQPGEQLYESMKGHLDANGAYKGTCTGWTPSLNDNVTAKLDFSGLLQAADASDLYKKLSELVGTELSFPCGTCTSMEAIRFGGEYEGINGLVFQDGLYDHYAKTEIDLSKKKFSWDGKEYTGYFDAVTDVMAMEDSNPDKAVKTAQLAKAVAADLAGSTYRALSGVMTKHYDRAVQIASEPYSVYVYDYRDTNVISPGSSVSAQVGTSASVMFEYERSVTGGYMEHYDHWASDQVWIQASDEVGDGIPISTRHLSAEGMDLIGYRVDTYLSEIVMEDQEEYQKRLDAWYAKVPEPKTEVYKKKVTVTTITPPELRWT